MASIVNQPEEPVRIVGSGYRHPYFVTTRKHTDKQDRMFAQITSYPAVGCWSVLPASQKEVAFSVLVESSHSSLDGWTFEIWWGSHGSAWASLPLTTTASLAGRVLSSSRQSYHHWLTAFLPRPSQNFQFTIRFKSQSFQEWKWVTEAYGSENGRIILQTPTSYEDKLEDYFDNLDTGNLVIQKQASDTPDTALWLVSGLVEAAQDDVSGLSQYILGKAKQGQRWFALVRLMTPWLAPRHGRFMHQLAKDDAILYSFLRDDGLHVVLLAVSGVDNVQTVLCQHNDQLGVTSRNEDESPGRLRVLVAVGRSFDFALAAAVYKARSIVSPYSTSLAASTSSDGSLKTNWVQDWYVAQ